MEKQKCGVKIEKIYLRPFNIDACQNVCYAASFALRLKFKMFRDKNVSQFVYHLSTCTASEKKKCLFPE